MQAIRKAGHVRLIDDIKKEICNKFLAVNLKIDLQTKENKLEKLFETYQDTINQLEKCITEYNTIQRKSEIELRQLKIRQRKSEIEIRKLKMKHGKEI